jgi:tripartite-type tricarboxylate transporter receptor subunit TctC
VAQHSVLVPAKTPKPIVQRLNGELVKIVNLPDVKTRFLEQGLTPVGSRPEDVSKLIREESAEYAKLVKAIDFKPL